MVVLSDPQMEEEWQNGRGVVLGAGAVAVPPAGACHGAMALHGDMMGQRVRSLGVQMFLETKKL
jgi:hypothetical protein